MNGLEKLFLTALGAGAGYLVGNSLGNTPEEKERYGKNLALLGGGIALRESFLNEEDDTINYTLMDRGRRVYEGIVYEDRLDARIREHEYDGKKFDDVIYSDAKTRSKALELERKRIKKYAPKYNVHHNS